MAGEGDVYSLLNSVEWVPQPTARIQSVLNLVEWVPQARARDYTQTQLIEWAVQANAYEYVIEQFVEWQLAPQISVRMIATMVEWIRGNTLYVEPANIHIEGGGAPIISTIYGAGEGLEVKEYARYQLLDTENGSEMEGLQPSGLNFQGGPIPPGGPNTPRPGAGFGAESQYNAKDGSPIVGPDLVD